MKVLVAVKRVVDFNAKIRVKADGSGVETDHVKMSLNPFDEIAIEEAIRLKEQNNASEVIVVSIGTPQCQETLRTALALGADRAILIVTEQMLEPFHIAKILQKIVEKEQPQLVILGKQAIDDDCNQTGQMLAGFLGWSQGTFISKLSIQGQQAQVTREVDAGLEVLQITLPAVVTTDLRLNQPRYATLPNIMRAKQKPIQMMDLDQLQLNIQVRSEVLKMTSPPQRSAGIKVKNIKELLDKIKEKVEI